MFISYFCNLLCLKSVVVNPFSASQICDIHHFRISSDISSQLIAMPFMKEIKLLCSFMPKSKASGPYSFPVEFFLDN